MDEDGVSSQGGGQPIVGFGAKRGILGTNSVSGRYSMTLGHEASARVENYVHGLQGEENVNVLKDANHTQLLVERG